MLCSHNILSEPKVGQEKEDNPGVHKCSRCDANLDVSGMACPGNSEASSNDSGQAEY